MKAIGIIPARWASKRFPGKILAPLCGKPLIQWVLERCRLAEKLSGVYVATDDERIRSAVEAVGGDVIMTRPDHESGTDRVAEALSVIGEDVDAVVNIQGDEPLMDPGLIDEHVSVMISEPCWDMATAAAPIRSEAEAGNTSVVKVVFAADGRALYFSRSVIPFIRDADFDCGGFVHWRHIGIYFYRREFLCRLVAEPPCLLERVERLEQLRALDIGGRIRVIQTEWAGSGVDMPEDAKAVELEMKRLGWS